MKLGLSRLLGPLAPRRAQGTRIALAAIVRNEAEYLVEWIAWHRNAGFTDFFLSDNGSDDGTLELLQRLAAAGVVRLRQEPRGAAAQLKAYNAMLATWGRDVDRIAYLDADEFLVASDERRPVDHLEDLLAASDVGAVAVNWRMFGSSGHQQRQPGLVIERFTRCAPDDYRGCIHVKTYARPAAIAQQRIHRANLKPGFRYVDTAGQPMDFVNIHGERPPHGGELSASIGPGVVRVHHYLVKSLQEYTEKKRTRGDAMVGPAHDRGMGYFRANDLNDIECLYAARQVQATRHTMEELLALIGKG